jgi:hypothetical protein
MSSADDLGVDAELRVDEARLRGELLDRLDQDAAFRAAQEHLQAEVAGVAADVEHARSGQVVGDVRRDRLPTLGRVVARRAAVARTDAVRKLEVVMPPAELADGLPGLLSGQRPLRTAKTHGRRFWHPRASQAG